MKKIYLLFALLFISTLSFSQILRNDKYEMYLLNFQENEVNIAKGMYMTNKPQYYYEGTIEVTFMDTGNTKKYNFFFTSWDESFKEFQVKDAKFKILEPTINFEGKTKAIIKKEDNKETIDLEDTSSLDNSILSTMSIWLDNQKK